jgi:hypothetical protein
MDKDFLGNVLGSTSHDTRGTGLVKHSRFKSGADRGELLRRTKDGFRAYSRRQAGSGDLKSGTSFQDC